MTWVCAGHAWLKNFQWVAIAAVAVGIPLILLKGLVSLRHLVLDINILMTVAVAGALQPQSLSQHLWSQEGGLKPLYPNLNTVSWPCEQTEPSQPYAQTMR